MKYPIGIKLSVIKEFPWSPITTEIVVLDYTENWLVFVSADGTEFDMNIDWLENCVPKGKLGFLLYG